MNILGISAGFSHDPAACIMVDGEIIYAIEEERIPLPGEIVKCVESYISSVE